MAMDLCIRSRSKLELIKIDDVKHATNVTSLNLRVAFAIAPINTGGIAMARQPNAATYDRTCARPAVLLDRTLWK